MRYTPGVIRRKKPYTANENKGIANIDIIPVVLHLSVHGSERVGNVSGRSMSAISAIASGRKAKMSSSRYNAFDMKVASNID
jgi:hypothetical protein